jgi:hypothetical protein
MQERGSPMTTFVIMPFKPEFDDVYAAIKQTVEAATTGANSCFRSDEMRPAGRITDRMLGHLQSADLCIADVSGNNPNVMWELGYVMALQKPTIVITQKIADLPFDLRDMQSIEYERNRLNGTLAPHLRRVVADTIAAQKAVPKRSESGDSHTKGLVSELMDEVKQLKAMISETVSSWKPSGPPSRSDAHEVAALVGSWRAGTDRTHYYAEMVNGELIVPYCYEGNGALTGAYYGWRKAGEYWFARYRWIGGEHEGFSFLRQESQQLLRGAWWLSHGKPEPDSPPERSGVPSVWHRVEGARQPKWARDFLEQVRREGLPKGFLRQVA